MILCWFIQRVLGGATPRSGSISVRIRSHLASCARCRAFQANQDRVVQRLRKEAEIERHPAPAFLHGKILSRIDRASIEPTRIHRRLLPRWAVAGMIASACFVGILYNQTGKYFLKIDRSVENSTRSNPVEVDREAYRTAASDFLPSSRLQSWTLTLEQPLGNELHAVVNDAQHALSHLAQSFLPDPIEH